MVMLSASAARGSLSLLVLVVAQCVATSHHHALPVSVCWLGAIDILTLTRRYKVEVEHISSS